MRHKVNGNIYFTKNMVQVKLKLYLTELGQSVFSRSEFFNVINSYKLILVVPAIFSIINFIAKGKPHPNLHIQIRKPGQTGFKTYTIGDH